MKVHEFMHEMRTTSAILGRSSGVSVVFEGNEAKTDGKVIYLPALNQQTDLTQEQVLAMRGYVDHESGHLRHSDMPRIMSFYDKNQNNGREDLSHLHNALEDVWMEDKVLDEYPGAWKNLRQVNELVRATEWSGAEEAGFDTVKEFFANDINAATSAAITTHKNEDFATEHNEKMKTLVSDKTNTMGEHYSKLAKECETTSDVVELSKKIYQYNKETNPEDQSPEDFDGKADGEQLEDMAGEEAEGENSEGFGKGQGESEGQGEGEGKGSGEPSKNPLEEATKDLGEILTMADDAKGAGGIGKCVDNGLRGGYRVYSTGNDKTYKRGGKSSPNGSYHVEAVVEDTTHTGDYDQRKTELKSDVMVMKNKLRRAVMAKQQRDWDCGREFGRLDSKRLVAASQGVKQVWKRRTDREDFNTAISILVDLSGSMGGSKARVARDCAIALSECFEGTQISYRISGFSNNGRHTERSAAREVSGQYHRYERLDHSIFKDYDDSLRVTRGSVYLINKAVGGNNSDYDFVDKELFELSKRPEQRKVLFVLSDGHVACHSDAPTHEHNRLIKENLGYYKKTKGIESVGIGIMDDSVKGIYPDNVVVNNVSDLSKTTFNKLTDILFRDKR